MSELRERNQYLEETVKLHQHSSMKLSQEKERAVQGVSKKGSAICYKKRVS